MTQHQNMRYTAAGDFEVEDKAKRLKLGGEMLRATQAKGREPGRDDGKRLTTLKRGDNEEIRVTWSEYNDRHFLSIRMWWRDQATGEWKPDGRKGITIRPRELSDFADGVASALGEAAADNGDAEAGF